MLTRERKLSPFAVIGVFALILLSSRAVWAEAKDHYNQGWFSTKSEAYSASIAYFHQRHGAAAACATFTEQAPQVTFQSFYETQTTYTWDINNDGSCPADGYIYVREVICQNGATFAENGGCVTPWSGDPKNAGAQPNMCENGSNPINTATGNKYQKEVDYVGTAQSFLHFDRYYNSSNLAAGELGVGWTHTYSRSIVLSAVDPSVTPPVARIRRPDGKEYKFTWNGSAWIGDPDVIGRLSHGGTLTSPGDVPCPAGGMSYVNEEDETESYNGQCQLTKITTRWGFEQTLIWNLASSSGGDGNPLTLDRVQTRYIVSGGVNQAITFKRDSTGRISQVVTPGGEIYRYTYDAQFRLTSVGYPVLSGTSPTRVYHYENSAFPFALTGITDEGGQRYATWTYDTQGRAYVSEHAGSTQRVEFTYNGDGTTAVHLPSGQVRTHHVSTQHNTGKVSQIDGGFSAFCGSKEASRTYDANGFRHTATDFGGVVTEYTHDARGLETQRIEALGTPNERRVVTSWHSTWRVPLQIDTYDASLNPLKRTTFMYTSLGQVQTRTETDLQAAPPVSRTTTYSYFTSGITKGFLQQINGPRQDVNDTVTYGYSSGTGNRLTTTDALGHVDTVNGYDDHGRLKRMTDRNGVVHQFTYHPRGWLLSADIAGEVSTFDYWPTGLLKKATLPDGSSLSYSYDAAHRLTDITDAEGNYIHYTLDAMGNRTSEQVFDDSNALIRARTRVFNTLNQLSQEIGAAGGPSVTTTYGYDNNGNQTLIAAPLGRNTSESYDELNRLSAITDPNSGVTTYGYNALDQLISVTDPRNLTTTYTYNALGDLKVQVSPDTGTTTNTYDSGGNLSTSTDARGALTTYGYDALNRVTSASFALGGTTDQTITYGYDAGTHGVGHLTSASDADHSMSWSYDARGRVLSKTQTIGVTSKTISYGYTNGQLTSITTPSNQSVTYTYTNGLVTSVSVNGTTILSNAIYDPFGPVRQWTWGNGSLSVRTYDQDGKITQLDSAGLNTYSYDDAFRITGITDTTNAANSWTYGYDLLDRLTSANKSGTTIGYTYDANGNRLTQTGTSPSTYTVSPTSNRLNSTNGSLTRSYTFDAAGNIISDGTHTFVYNNRGRMKSSTTGGTTTNYTYNALGQRIKKSGTTRLFYYDEAGHLIGEYDASGTLVQETIWLGDTPIATLRPNGSGVDLFYVHTDHLNTPRKITRPSDNALMWTYTSDPFGNGGPNENPSGLGTFSYNLRFPGQYYDQESGLNYNYFRDYDPAVGRYIQSDPIGLRAGVNTYAYVKSNPLSLDDPSGLDSRAEPQPCIGCWPFAPPTKRPPGGWWEEEFAKDVWDGAKNIAKWIKDSCTKEDTSECDKEWEWAYRECEKLVNDPVESQNWRRVGKRPPTVHSCARGFVSQRCGGNKVTDNPKP